MGSIRKIYSILYEKFGPQHWWPVTKDKEIIPKYRKRSKLSEKQKLEIVFGAILTQNTSWKNVEKAIINLNKNNLINIKKINKISLKKLASLIRPSGYYNQKAERLKLFSNYILKNYNGNLNLLLKKDVKELREELLSLNGIGPETADSILLYAAEKPVFVVDAYTKRIYSRVFNIKRELKYESLQEIFESNLKKEAKLFNEYHALLVELGKNYCKRRAPLCGKCPVNNHCKYPSGLGRKA